MCSSDLLPHPDHRHDLLREARLLEGPVEAMPRLDGDYTGNNGKLVVNTLWNSDADKDSDHLIVKGTASGTTVVSTPNGIIGNISKTNAQQFSSDVVTVETPSANAPNQQEGQPDSNAIFTGTANTTNAGQAQLVLKSTAGGKNVYAWTLFADPNATTDRKSVV